MNQPGTIEEELAIIAEAIEAGIDPFPPKKPPGFEPGSWHPECHMMDHYTKGLASMRHRSIISTNPSDSIIIWP